MSFIICDCFTRNIPRGNFPRISVNTIKWKQFKLNKINFELFSQETFPGETLRESLPILFYKCRYSKIRISTVGYGWRRIWLTKFDFRHHFRHVFVQFGLDRNDVIHFRLGTWFNGCRHSWNNWSFSQFFSAIQHLFVLLAHVRNALFKFFAFVVMRKMKEFARTFIYPHWKRRSVTPMYTCKGLCQTEATQPTGMASTTIVRAVNCPSPLY